VRGIDCYSRSNTGELEGFHCVVPLHCMHVFGCVMHVRCASGCGNSAVDNNPACLMCGQVIWVDSVFVFVLSTFGRWHCGMAQVSGC
jgi:hypothetical protein